jgi:serine/threonine-protein kinase HipA
MPYTPVDAIEVRAWDQRVGALAQDPRTGAYAFEYDPAWKAGGIELAPTTMPLAGRRVFSFPNLPRDTYHRLPAIIADALPDAFGRSVLDAQLAREGVRPDQITPLDRLAYLASRGMGALEFRPARGPRTTKPSAVRISDLVQAARAAVDGTFDGDDETRAALTQLIAVGTSAGGARAKAVIAWNRTTDEIHSGQLPAEPGFEQWLMKLDGTGDDGGFEPTSNWGRVEYAYHLMAVAAGVDMTECTLIEEGGRAHFATRRFDRDGVERIHASTLCAMAELDFRAIGVHDYSQLFQTVDRLDLGPSARQQVFRRMAFNVAAANCDDHTKNFAFLLPRGGTWELAPAYDITHAHLPGNRWIERHLMSVNGKFEDITIDDLLSVADRFAVPEATSGLRDVLAATDSWGGFAREAGVPTARIDEVAIDLKTVRPR